MGHNRIVLTTDNEHAILAVLRTTLKTLRVEGLDNIQEAHPAAYDAASNGSTEIACKTIGGMISTLRACLEGRLRRQIPVTHCTFAWLVEPAAWLHTIKKTQSDTLTAYQRFRGMSVGPKLLGFGGTMLVHDAEEVSDQIAGRKTGEQMARRSFPWLFERFRRIHLVVCGI